VQLEDFDGVLFNIASLCSNNELSNTQTLVNHLGCKSSLQRHAWSY
jgi:hypothetical protein